MLLTATTDKIEVVLGASVTTNQLHIISSYNDTTSSSVTPTKTVTVTNNTTAVDLVPSPASGHQRSLRWASIFNSDIIDATVTIRTNYNGTTRTVFSTNLKVNEYIQYTHRTGWKVFDQNGALKSNINAPQSNEWNALAHSMNLTLGGQSLGTTTYCTYMGKATGNHKLVNLSGIRLTAFPVTVTWAEVGIYKGKFNVGSSVSLTRLGWTDLGTGWNGSNVNKWVQVQITNCQAGDDLWFVIGNSASTSMSIRSLSIVDDIGAGFLQSAGSNRPSLNTTLTGTVVSATTPLFINQIAFI